MSEDQLIQRPHLDLAKRFREMADRIEHNQDSKFGGAVVLVPPVNGGATIELLMLDVSGDPAQFWSTISTRIQIRLKELEDQQRATTSFGRR